MRRVAAPSVLSLYANVHRSVAPCSFPNLVEVNPPDTAMPSEINMRLLVADGTLPTLHVRHVHLSCCRAMTMLVSCHWLDVIVRRKQSDASGLQVKIS